MYYHVDNAINLQNIPPNIMKAQKILELIIKNKYFVSAHLLYAKLKYLLNDKNTAISTIQNILNIDSQNLDAYILYALILLNIKDNIKAKEIINEAMIQNLVQTRENFYFQMSKAKCELALNEFDNSQKSLNEALRLFDKVTSSGETKNSIFQAKPKDKLELMKLNIEILLKMGKNEEAQLQINKLIGEMQDSNMEDDILFLNSELALKSGDLKKAVNLLKVYS
jgi:tetratricopeptide repeat protein 21B